jgi:hypothetical protein
LLQSSLSVDKEIIVDSDSLANLAHQVLTSILQESLPTATKVASLVETMMVVAVMTPEGTIRPARFVTAEGA